VLCQVCGCAHPCRVASEVSPCSSGGFVDPRRACPLVRATTLLRPPGAGDRTGQSLLRVCLALIETDAKRVCLPWSTLSQYGPAVLVTAVPASTPSAMFWPRPASFCIETHFPAGRLDLDQNPLPLQVWFPLHWRALRSPAVPCLVGFLAKESLAQTCQAPSAPAGSPAWRWAGRRFYARLLRGGPSRANVIKGPADQDPVIKAPKAPGGGPPRSAAVSLRSAFGGGLGDRLGPRREGFVGLAPGAASLKPAHLGAWLCCTKTFPAGEPCDHC